MKKIIKILLGIIVALIVVFGGYLIYLFVSYDRLPDAITLNPVNRQTQMLETNKTYRAMSHNIGYGAYPPSYSFFMDGGDYSRAYDKKTVKENMQGIVQTTKELAPTFAFYQEVDQDGDRSQHVDQVAFLGEHLEDYNHLYGQNYDSAYLFYPFTDPIGKAKSGLVTLSQAEITSSKRYSLPIETNFNKFFDLDRAFTVSRMPVKGGHEFIAINTHLSAFTKDRSIQAAQLEKIFNVMENEYKKGNYVLVAGDYNHDVLGNSPEVFNTSKKRETWTHPFPKDQLPAGFQLPTGRLAAEKIPSARALDKPYKEGKSYTTLIDGFLVSDNIAVNNVHVKDMQFKYSDHNPVYLDFSFK
ncbi:endonuclease/exonuclease/phosphatase family protein [Enterococcus xiangfangensis]|uniref:endonuclease/exonuclease/phosphatase family protein n=1 Tax=Enterococcus xiangfangensis TaxID=1296537 RepID=UPI0010F798F1|nr:hydrolase [Enterococcus xiangfangensis]MBM7711242.1 endonuclease/exonuclease/phosphatase family metal-dependent hydrolase [Enterococcus xiangfangensis]NBK09436.1 hydrolase [Enterococcus asini]